MGLFGKIKNILFDEEEDLEISNTDKEEKVIEPKKEEKKTPIFKEPVFEDEKPVKKPVSFEDEFVEKVITPKESSSAPSKNEEKGFRFPLEFNEEDFPKSAASSVSLKTTSNLEVEKENYRTYDRYTIKKTEEKIIEKRPFKASPVISPIYGIMDKNYKKGDIQEKSRPIITEEQKKRLDLETVRKKAFGETVEDLEVTLNRPIEDFYQNDLTLDDVVSPFEEIKVDTDISLNDPIKSIDDLLINTSDEEEKPTDVNFEKVTELNETFKLDEVISELKKTSDNLSSEEDLFNLIDSLYEERDND